MANFEAGDIVLYRGELLLIYYNSNERTLKNVILSAPVRAGALQGAELDSYLKDCPILCNITDVARSVLAEMADD